MVKQNMHIHSKYSWDSAMEIEEIAQVLIRQNIQYGAITDHIEFDKEPIMYVLTKLKIRNLEIDEINKKYEGKINLLKAVEISEPHLYKEKVEQLSELDLDFIMGSIHNIDRNAITELEKFRTVAKYYREVLAMVQANQIDVIGHLDYINRYYEYDYSSISQIIELMQAIKENNQILEINTSAQRRMGTSNTFPSTFKVHQYRSLGQDEIIIGTDAHKYSELVDNLNSAKTIEEEMGLKPVIYQKRKRIII